MIYFPNKIFFCKVEEINIKGYIIKFLDELKDEIIAFVDKDTKKIKIFSSICPHFGGEIYYSDKDNLLIYYAGHGDIVNSNAYWIPKNGTKNISSTWLNTKDIESAISMISAKDLLVMIDSCFQGTAFKSGSQKIEKPTKNEIDDENYFKKMLSYRSATVITSGNNEPVVDATIEGHSHFAFKFIDILKNNNK